jgi:hypothetical protein
MVKFLLNGLREKRMGRKEEGQRIQYANDDCNVDNTSRGAKAS